MELTAKEVEFDELRDLSNHAREIGAVVEEKAGEHEDEALHLAARSLRRMTERLSEHVLDGVPEVDVSQSGLVE